jgi:H+/gluconate symporter-like permease
MKLSVVTNSVAFITGSCSGAESTCLELFSKYFLELGIHPEVIHKMAIISASGFDTMPWNSLVVLFLTMAGLNYKSSYKHIFVTCVLMTVVIGLITVFLAGLMY